MGLQQFYRSDERRSLGRAEKRGEDRDGLQRGLADPALGIDQSGDDGGGDVLQVELVTGEGQEAYLEIRLSG